MKKLIAILLSCAFLCPVMMSCDSDDDNTNNGQQGAKEDDKPTDDKDAKCDFGDDADETCISNCVDTKCQPTDALKACMDSCLKEGGWDSMLKELKDDAKMSDDAIEEIKKMNVKEYKDMMAELESMDQDGDEKKEDGKKENGEKEGGEE